MRGHEVTSEDGTTLYVEEAGDPGASPILFVHGYSQSRLAWGEQLDSDLADEFHLVAMDLRGHGESEKPHDAYGDPEVWAADVRAVIDALDLEDVALVGWSYGGNLLADYLAAYGGDDVAGLNLVSAAVDVEGVDVDATGPGFLDLASGLTSTDAEESVETLDAFVRNCVSGDLPPRKRYLVLGYNAAVPPRVRGALMEAEHEPLPADLALPVLVTHGEEDEVIRPVAAEEHAGALPTAELSLYPGVGHSPFLEAPDRFNRELREFVSGL